MVSIDFVSDSEQMKLYDYVEKGICRYKLDFKILRIRIRVGRKSAF